MAIISSAILQSMHSAGFVLMDSLFCLFPVGNQKKFVESDLFIRWEVLQGCFMNIPVYVLEISYIKRGVVVGVVLIQDVHGLFSWSQFCHNFPRLRFCRFLWWSLVSSWCGVKRLIINQLEHCNAVAGFELMFSQCIWWCVLWKRFFNGYVVIVIMKLIH